MRALTIGPLAFARRWQNWLDAVLVASALALELALHGQAAVTANLAVIVLRLARIGHAFVELAWEDAERGREREAAVAEAKVAAARAAAARRAWRLAATPPASTSKPRGE